MNLTRLISINVLISSFLLAGTQLLCQDSLPVYTLKSQSNKVFKSQDKAIAYLNKKIDNYQNKGFVSAYYDSIVNADTVSYSLIKGERFYINKIKTEDDILSIWNKNKWFQLKKYDDNIEKSINFYENIGFPYVSINTSLDSSYVNSNRNQTIAIDLDIEVDKGPYYVLDSILLKGDIALNRKVFQNMLDFQQYDYYQEQKINNINQTINNTVFLKSFRDSEVEFHDSTFTIYTYVNKKSVSSFSGIVGFEQQDNGKLNITGDLDLNLNNVFQHAEVIQLNWKSYQNASQDLLISGSIPYVFNTSFGLTSSLKLNKQDTSFLNINFKAGLLYNIKPNTSLLVSYNQVNSNVLGGQFSQEYVNTNMNLFGLGIKTMKLDYLLNPQKGYFFEFVGAFGKKNYPGQESTIDTSFQSVTSVIYETNIRWFIPVFPKLTLLLGVNSKGNFSDLIYKNELFRIGGAKILRGFDQESIFTSWYIVNTLEIRYIFEEYSNFYAFYDLGHYTQKTETEDFSDQPFGFGLGMRFGTKGGVFDISYALGKQFNNPILFKNAKIHFGYSLIF